MDNNNDKSPKQLREEHLQKIEDDYYNNLDRSMPIQPIIDPEVEKAKKILFGTTSILHTKHE
jgi:hypothetical protein